MNELRGLEADEMIWHDSFGIRIWSNYVLKSLDDVGVHGGAAYEGDHRSWRIFYFIWVEIHVCSFARPKCGQRAESKVVLQTDTLIVHINWVEMMR